MNARATASARWKRTLRLLLGALLFAVATAAGIVLHVGTPAGRALATQAVNQLVSAAIRGRLELGSITALSLNSAELSSVDLYDPGEEQVLSLRGLSAEFNALQLLGALLFDSAGARISIPHLRAESANVRLFRDSKSDKYTIELAVQSAKPKDPKRQPSPGPDLELSNIELGRTEVAIALGGDRTLLGIVTRARASLQVTQDKLLVVIERLGADLGLAPLAAPGSPDDAAQKFRAVGTGTARIEVPGAASADFQGFLGDIELQANATLTGDHLSADIKLPRVTPAAARQYWADWPLEVPCNARARASGTLPELDIEADLSIGRGRRTSTLAASGALQLSDPVTAQFELAAEGVNLRHFWPEAPRTAARLQVQGEFGKNPEASASSLLRVNGTLEPGRVWDQALPNVELELTAAESVVTLDAAVFEAGAPARAHVTVDGKGKIDWTVTVEQLKLAEWQRFEHRHAGTGKLHVVGSLDHGLLDTTLDADLRSVRFQPPRGEAVRAGRLTTRSRVTGKVDDLDTLQVQGRATVEAMSWSGYQILSGKAVFRGDLKRLETELSLTDVQNRHLELTGSWLDLASEHPELRGARASLTQGPFEISGTIVHFAPSQGTLDVDPFTIAGAGSKARGHLKIRPTSLDAQFSSDGIDLAQLARTLGLPANYLRGRLQIEAEFVTGEDLTRGRVSANFQKVSVMGFGQVTAHLHSTLEGTTLTGSLEGEDAVAGKFATNWEAELAGGPLEAQSYRNATGHGRLLVQSISLDPLSLLLPEASPIQSISGDLGAEIQLNRPSKEQRAVVFYNVGTTPIQIAAKDLLVTDKLENPRVHVGGMFNFQTGDIKASTLIFDDQHEILSLAATAHSDLLARIGSDEEGPTDVQTEIVSMPIDAVITLSRRPIASLPLRGVPEGLAGNVGATLSVRGSYQRPQLFVTISADDVRAALDPAASALNIQVQAGYAPHATGQPKLQAKADIEHEGRSVGRLLFTSDEIDLTRAEWLTDIKLSGLPGSLLPSLISSEVDTALHGSVEFKGAPTNRSMRAQLQLRPLKVQGTDYGQVDINFEGRDDTYSGEVVQRSSLAAPPSLSANILARSKPDELLPSHLQIALSSKHMQAGLLAPVLEPVATRISGWVDGDFAVVLERDDDNHWSTRVDGSGRLSAGATHIPDLGLTLTGVEATTVARSAGNRTSFALNGLKATARASEPNITGDLNLVLEDLRVTGGMGFFDVDHVPLTFQGVSQGTGTGKVALQLERDENLMLVTLGLPDMHVRLPQSSSRDLISLDDHEEISIAQYDKEEEELDPDSLIWRLVLDLGDDVRVTRADANIPIEGQPSIEFGAETRLRGTIRLKQGGRIPVLGKVLQIEQGTIQLNPDDPGNPTLDVTASWRAPDGTMIFVHVDGPWKDDRPPRLSSNPPLPEGELMAILLGASTTSESDRTTSEDEGTTGGAMAFGGGVAASGVSQLLGEQLSDVELRVDAPSESSGYGAAAAVRLGPKLWFETSYERTDHAIDPAANDNIVTGTLDYRFTRRWSLRTAVGTAGGTLDLLWQYRY